MRIGQFTTQYPYPRQFRSSGDYFCSGAEKVVEEISKHLGSNGENIHVFTSAKSASYSLTNQKGVQIHRSPSFGSVSTTQVAPSLLVDPIVSESPPLDIVHAHNSTPPGIIAAYLYSKVTSTPLVITHHGGENYESGKGIIREIGLRGYLNYGIDTVFDSAEVITVPSEGYISESKPLSETAVSVTNIPNGISSDLRDDERSKKAAKLELGYSPSDFIYLFLGSHQPRKGPRVLLNSFLQLCGDNQDMKLILAGDGELTTELQEQAATHKQSSDVSFPGYVSESEKPAYMAAADIFVLPSTIPATEVFPLSILEAGAYGTPIITSDFPALRSIIRKYQCGFLANPDDPRDLKETMSIPYEYTDIFESASDNAFKMVQKLTWEEVSKRYLNVYENVLYE